MQVITRGRRVAAVLALSLTLVAVGATSVAVPIAQRSAPPVRPASADVTLADLQAMFPRHVGDASVVSRGLANLNAVMRREGITTPARRAAFLTTIAYESAFLYNVRARGDGREFAGRGHIQLTGVHNYADAGTYFGVDLVSAPERARSLRYSAAIAGWYWTVARDINPMADALDMGRVNAAIGYPPGPHDQLRCDAFTAALRYYLGSVPPGVNCVRPTAYAGLTTPTSDLTREQWEALGD